MINDLYLPSYDGVYDDEVYCCEYEEGSWAWKDIFYDLSKKVLHILLCRLRS